MIDNNSITGYSSLASVPENFMGPFRTNIFNLMKSQNVTLQTLADEADIPISTLKTLLYGNAKDCHISTAIKLSKVLNVSVDELLGAETVPPYTCESLKILRSLPESFTHFIRWIIRFHRDMTFSHPEITKAVEVMELKCSDSGSLKVTSNLEFSDISDFEPELRTKIFMGIIMPAYYYEPFYFEGDTLYIANDRAPREGEPVVVSIDDCIWILNAKRERIAPSENGNDRKYNVTPSKDRLTTNYYSLRDGRLFASSDQIQSIIGYVAKVKRG